MKLDNSRFVICSKKGPIFLTILFVSFLCISGGVYEATADDIVVGDKENYPNADYHSIQRAIDNAQEGESIWIKKGRYEENLVISKSITLIGENSTILARNPRENTISISEGEVKIDNITITGGKIGIYIHSNKHNTITESLITNNGDIGIYLHNSSKNKIIDNTVAKNKGDGIQMEKSNYNTITDNKISLNGLFGIYLYIADNNTLTGNTITANNFDGVNIFASYNNVIAGNTITGHDLYGIRLISPVSKNQIYHNNFINNGKHARDEGNNTWYNATINEGNYWGDYNGTDIDGDGIRDTPYAVSGGSSQDKYPLVNPFENADKQDNGKKTSAFGVAVVFMAMGSVLLWKKWKTNYSERRNFPPKYDAFSWW